MLRHGKNQGLFAGELRRVEDPVRGSGGSPQGEEEAQEVSVEKCSGVQGCGGGGGWFIKSVVKNWKGEKGEVNLNFGEENQDKKLGGEEYQVVGNF